MPTFTKRIPLRKEDLTGDIQTLSGYKVVLRKSPFTLNTLTGVEATDAPGYYDFTGIEYGVAYRKYSGTTLDTLSQDFSFSGADGEIIASISGDAIILDPNDFERGDFIKVVNDGNTANNVFVNTIPPGGYLLRVKLVDLDGTFFIIDPMLLENNFWGANTFLNVFDDALDIACDYPDTGQFQIQFAQVLLAGTYICKPITLFSLANVVIGYIVGFKSDEYRFTYTVVDTSGVAGGVGLLSAQYAVSKIARVSSSLIRLQLTGHTADILTLGFKVGTKINTIGVANGTNILPLIPDAEYTLTAVDSGNLYFAFTTTSGTLTILQTPTIGAGVVLQNEIILDIIYYP